MRDLYDLGLKGRLSHFINWFLLDRKFKIRIGSTLSDMKNQEEGVPQGSVLSMTLFSIKIKNIIECLSPWVDGSLYVDNLLICFRSKYIHTIEHNLQQCLDKINKWITENGFRFCKTKTVHFCRLYLTVANSSLFCSFLIFFRSRRKSCVKALLCGFHAKTDKNPLTGAHPHPQNECPLSCHNDVIPPLPMHTIMRHRHLQTATCMQLNSCQWDC